VNREVRDCQSSSSYRIRWQLLSWHCRHFHDHFSCWKRESKDARAWPFILCLVFALRGIVTCLLRHATDSGPLNTKCLPDVVSFLSIQNRRLSYSATTLLATACDYGQFYLYLVRTSLSLRRPCLAASALCSTRHPQTQREDHRPMAYFCTAQLSLVS